MDQVREVGGDSSDRRGFSTKPVIFLCTKPVNRFSTKLVNHFSTKLVKNVFCTKPVNDNGVDFFGTMVVNGVLARWGAKKERMWMFLMLVFLLMSARIKAMHLKSSVIFD